MSWRGSIRNRPWRLRPSSLRATAICSRRSWSITSRSTRRRPPVVPAKVRQPLCQWRVVWAALARIIIEARVTLLKEQVEKFPTIPTSGDALFFLGRAEEQRWQLRCGAHLLRSAQQVFPHYYYAGLARTRPHRSKLAAAKEDPTVRAWLEKTADAAHFFRHPRRRHGYSQ